MTRRPAAPLVLKLGGELLEEATRVTMIAAAIARTARETPLVIVHGGGREIDAELAIRDVPRRTVDGLRITDEPTLDVVIGVLAGRVNTRLVAACVAAGAAAVGLTGADAGAVRVAPAEPYRKADGTRVDLGLVGQPLAASGVPLLADLCSLGYVPVVASIGIGANGRLFNVNADILAVHLAGALRASRLVIAGATAGVLDEAGRTIPRLGPDDIDTFVARGGATAGMIAKLAACRDALQAGVKSVAIVDGRSMTRLDDLRGTEIEGARPTPGPGDVTAARPARRAASRA